MHNSPEPDSGEKKRNKSETRKVPAAPAINASKAETLKLSPEQSEQEDSSQEKTIFDTDAEMPLSSETEKTLMAIAEKISQASVEIEVESATNAEKKPRKQREVLEAGKRFQGKYEILRLIGAGGMGQVYQARHLVLGNMVAIKVINRNMIAEDDEEAVGRFEREARANAKIEHPNAVRVFDFGVEDNICFLVMEYLEGESLRQRLAKRKKLPLADVIDFADQVCQVLDLIHRKGIIHRDLKPDNLFFHRQDEIEIVKVLDFGIAKMTSATSQLEGKLTGTGALIGTPHYMSPEQCQGLDLDSRSDLYTFGIILYEILSGQLPFNAENTLSMLFKHVREVAAPLCQIAPDVPPPISDVIMRALAKNPKKRYQSAKEFATALKEAMKVPAGSLITPAMKAVPDFDLPDLSTREHQTEMTRPLRAGEYLDTDENIKDLRRAKPDAAASSAMVEPEVKTVYQPAATSPLIKFLLPVILIGAIGGFLYWQMAMKQPVTAVKNTPIEKPTAAPAPAANPLGDNFVLISGGVVTIGADRKKCADSSDCKITEDELPAHSVTLAPYYLSKYELTNKEYREFIIATNHRVPSNWQGQDYPIGTDLLPVNFVSWEDAVAYCQWRSERDGIEFRLPTEEEWEYAAHGNDNRLYPWGDLWDNSLANVAKPPSVKAPLPVNAAPNNSGDRSPLDIYALGGNVMEWTASNFNIYPGSKYKPTGKDLECKVLRGGRFDLHKEEVPNALRTTLRNWNLPTEMSMGIGFRIAATPRKNQ